MPEETEQRQMQEPDDQHRTVTDTLLGPIPICLTNYGVIVRCLS